jgi:sulfatase maturation enzyme AslB (radical SAM superfamily)
MEKVNSSLSDQGANLRNLMVVPTYKCQMACRYCFINRSRQDMPEETLYRAIDLLLTSPCPEVELQFFGGEPLLRFDLVKKAFFYAEAKSREKSKKIKYFLVTNGLLLDEDKLTFLKQYNTTIMLSIDGARQTQVENRPLLKKDGGRYFNSLLRNLKGLLGRAEKCCVNLVFLPGDIKKLKANFDFLTSLGVRNIRLSYAIGADFRRKDLSEYARELKKIIRAARIKRVNLLNLDDEEPCFFIPQITIGSSGDVYVGCNFILETVFPECVGLMYAGELKSIKDISRLKRTRQEQSTMFIRKKRKLNINVVKNIYFGIGIYALLKYWQLCKEYAPLVSGVHLSGAGKVNARGSAKCLPILSRQGACCLAEIIADPGDLRSLIPCAMSVLASGAQKIKFSPKLGVFWTEDKIADYFIMLYNMIEILQEKKEIEIINISGKGSGARGVKKAPSAAAIKEVVRLLPAGHVTEKMILNNLVLMEVSNSFFGKFRQ